MEGFDSRDGDGEWHDHYFKFSDIVVVEDHDAPDQAPEDGTHKTKAWGLIRAYFFRMSKSAIKKREDYGEAPGASLTKGVAKKVLKGGFLTTMSAYETNASEKPDGVDMKQEDRFCNGRDRPFFIFEFRYLNKEGLYQAGVLERPDPTAGMTVDELRHLARKQLVQSQGEGPQVFKPENRDEVQPGAHGPGPWRKKVKVKETIRDDGIAQVHLLSDDDDDDDDVLFVPQ
ncbi:hypothetical protein PG993_009023 [Apiospora rasikravindrae]|uniref:DUF7918 domain-containing protein n=1 Tax=Apiospora rasikravindrae TaxID=990691 RepID=A0ABR1SI99_9PEZI